MPFTSRLAGSLTAAVLALSPLPGLTQTSAQAPKPKKPAPKTQPAQPQTGHPVIVQLETRASPAGLDQGLREGREGDDGGVLYHT
jgi:hypothetical protein